MKKNLLLLFALAASSAAFAQEREPEKSYTSRDTVHVFAERDMRIPLANTTAAKIALPLRLTPASVGVVHRALFESQEAIVMGDALRNVSGVHSQTGFGVFDYFSIRGFESLSNGLVLTDGAPEPEVTFYNLYNVERVEVLKGPSAFLYGGNPLSGVINLVRKRPAFENFLFAGSGYGKFTSYRSTVDLSLAHRASGAAFRLNGLWQDSESFRDGKENSNVSLNPAFLWQPNERVSLELNYERIDSEYHSDAGLPIFNGAVVDVPHTRSYQSPFDVSDQLLTRGRVDLNYKASDAATLRNKFYYTVLDWRSNGTLFNFTLPNATGSLDIYRTLTLLDDRQKLLGNQLEALFDFQTGGVAHKLVTGFEFTRLADDFTFDVAFLPSIDVFNPQEFALPGRFDPRQALIPGQSLVAEARYRTLAPYFVDQLALSKQLHLFLGGRFDKIAYEEKNTRTERNDEQFSPMAGVTFAPTNDLSLYANYGRAFGPPSTLVVGERKAEKSVQYEVGFKRRYYEGRLHTTVAVYHLEKENVAIPTENGVTQQLGNQRGRGVEADIAAQPGRNWHVFVNYAYNDAELTKFSEFALVLTPQGPAPQFFDRSGNAPAFAPKHLLNAWLNKEFDFGLGIGLGARYISAQFIAEDNAFAIDDVLTLDGLLYYDLGPWRVNVNFKNLTDREYFSRGFGTTSVIPANPFAVYGGLELAL
jgi:catecholate siderophore receptor